MAHARDLLGPGRLQVGRLCPVCGSDAHGQPWLRHAGRRIPVSLSRSNGHLVTALLANGDGLPARRTVGIDVERTDDVAQRVSPDLVRHPDDPATTDPGSLAWLWVAKEAILKASGSGLVRPMTEVAVSARPVRLINAPPGYVAAVCVDAADVC